jgi:hypothetical protein
MNISSSINKKFLFIFLTLTGLHIQIKAETSVPSSLLLGAGTAIGGGFGLLFGAACLESKINALLKTLEEKLIEQWIVQNNLNGYGEPKDTHYENGSPLYKYQTRLDYIKDKFIKKPWLKGYKSIFKRIQSSIKLVGHLAGFGTCISLLTILALPFLFTPDRKFQNIAYYKK